MFFGGESPPQNGPAGNPAVVNCITSSNVWCHADHLGSAPMYARLKRHLVVKGKNKNTGIPTSRLSVSRGLPGVSSVPYQDCRVTQTIYIDSVASVAYNTITQEIGCHKCKCVNNVQTFPRTGTAACDCYCSVSNRDCHSTATSRQHVAYSWTPF